MDTKLLRQKILDLAIHGKLVPQNPQHEPASKQLERIRTESKKPALPISEDEIPFEIPENWCWCRLEDVLSNVIVPQRDKPKVFDGRIPWCRIEDRDGDLLQGTKSNQYVSDKTINDMNLKVYPIGTILPACSGASIGSILINTVECCTNQTFIGLVVNKDILFNQYLFYFMKVQIMELKLQSTGTALQYISQEKFKKVLFPLPPLEEQKLIVAEIERIFALIDTVEQNKTDLETVIKQTRSKILDLAIHGKLVPQDKADEPASKMLEKLRAENTTKAGASGREKIAKGQLKRDKNDSYIYKAPDNTWHEKLADGTDTEIEVPFEIPESWCWCRLKEIANIARGGSPRPIEDFITDDENGINWIKIGDTKEGDKYITSVREKIKPEGIRHSRFVHSGDFLLTNSMSFGHPYILKVDGCIHDGWLVFADIGQVIDSDFLYYSLSSDFIYTAFSFVAAGSTVKNLKSDTVKETLFTLPPLEEQKRIVNKIEEAINKIDSILHSLGV